MEAMPSPAKADLLPVAELIRLWAIKHGFTGAVVFNLDKARAPKCKMDENFSTYRAHTKAFEGLRLWAYKDSRDIPTIGIGCNLTRKGMATRLARLGLDPVGVIGGLDGISEMQAETLFAQDIDDRLRFPLLQFPDLFLDCSRCDEKDDECCDDAGMLSHY